MSLPLLNSIFIFPKSKTPVSITNGSFDVIKFNGFSNCNLFTNGSDSSFLNPICKVFFSSPSNISYLVLCSNLLYSSLVTEKYKL